MQLSQKPHKDATWLAFDVSVVGASVALTHDGRLFSVVDDTPGRQAAQLVPMIEQVLGQAGIGYAQVQRLVTTIGPGSFTGIRIGLATAQGLVAASGMGVSVLTTLEALALQAMELLGDGPVWATLNAGKGEIYAQLFHVKQSEVVSQGHILLLSPALFAEEVQPGQRIVGNTHAMLPEELHGLYHAGAALPAAGTFVRAALPLAGDEALVPLYIRAPDAKLPAKA